MGIVEGAVMDAEALGRPGCKDPGRAASAEALEN